MKSSLFLILAAGLVARLVVLAAGSVDFLTNWPEFSTPADSLTTQLEASFRATHSLDLYKDGVVHYPPLVVVALQHVGAWLPWILAVFDTLTAVCLTRMHAATAPDTAWITATLSSLDPVFVLSVGSGSLSVFSRFWMSFSVYLALCARKTFYAGAAIACATYINPCYLVMVVPVAVAVGRPVNSRAQFSWPRCTCAVAGWALAGWGLLHASASMFGSWEFMSPVYGWRLWFTDITPNCTMSWYFFAEVLRFHQYYRLIFSLFPCAFLAPLTIWFHTQPIILITAMACILSLFMPYPTLSDPWLACVIGASQVHIVKLLPTVSWFWLTLAAVSATFMPVMRSLWLGPGSGNANFYFNMVSGGYFSCIAVDVIWGICQGMLHTLAWSLLLGNYVSTAVKSCSAKNVKAE